MAPKIPTNGQYLPPTPHPKKSRLSPKPMKNSKIQTSTPPPPPTPTKKKIVLAYVADKIQSTRPLGVRFFKKRHNMQSVCPFCRLSLRYN